MSDESGRIDAPDGQGPTSALMEFTSNAIEAIALVAFVAMMLCTLLQVAARFFLHIPLPWTEELARLLLLIAVLGGIAVAIWQREHIQVDFMHQHLGPATLRALNLAFDVAILGFLAMWLWGAVRMAGMSGAASYVTLPWFRVTYIYWVEAVAIVFMMLFVVARAVLRISSVAERAE